MTSTTISSTSSGTGGTPRLRRSRPASTPARPGWTRAMWTPSAPPRRMPSSRLGNLREVSRQKAVGRRQELPVLLGRLFGRRLSECKRLVKELAGLLQVRLASAGVGFEISLLSIHQVHVAHGVGIVWFEIELLQKRFQALVYQRADLLREFLARLRREGWQLALSVRHIQLQFLALCGVVPVSQSPVNGADPKVRLSVIGISLEAPPLVLLGLVEVMHLVVGLGDRGQRRVVVRVLFQHLLKGFDGLLADLDVCGRVALRDVKLLESGGQVDLGHEQRRVISHGLFEV